MFLNFYLIIISFIVLKRKKILPRHFLKFVQVTEMNNLYDCSRKTTVVNKERPLLGSQLLQGLSF